MASDEGVCDVMKNDSSKDCKNRLVTSKFDKCDHGNMRDVLMGVERHCGSCNDTVLNPTDSRQNFGVDRRMDVTLVDENSCDAIMEKRGGRPFPGASAAVGYNTCKALEDTTSKEQSDHCLWEGKKTGYEGPTGFNGF